MPKKLIVLMDGTWNTPHEYPETDGDCSTNVAILDGLITPRDQSGMEQRKHYISGVGTNWYDRLRGGAFGVGLSDKIKEGYEFLSRNHQPGDSIYIFGFSRGAYSARSLVGLIRNSGLLNPGHVDLIDEAYSLYRTRDQGADSANAIAFREKHSRATEIHFLGVWDTVGALGIPLDSFDWFNREYYQFHDTELSGIVRNAFHAVAVDEHREDYTAALWDPKFKPNQTVEQVWFSGAHANVGGGYANNSLSDLPLAWMIDKARGCELAVNDPVPSPGSPDIVDSYGQFMAGAYKLVKSRHFRTVGATVYGGESIDLSVQDRLASTPTYRPGNAVGEHLAGQFKPVARLRPQTQQFAS